MRRKKQVIKPVVITLSAIALADVAYAASTNLNINANIYGAISVPTVTHMDFGILTNGTGAGGTAVLDQGDSISFVTGSVSSVAGNPKSGTLVVVGDIGQNIVVSIPATVTITNTAAATETMKVNTFDCDPGTPVTRICTVSLAGGTATIDYGATLNVGAGQATGIYLGSVNVSIVYQ